MNALLNLKNREVKIIVIMIIFIIQKYYRVKMRIFDYTIENITLFAIKFLRKQ
jgi:hypothetical protein